MRLALGSSQELGVRIQELGGGTMGVAFPEILTSHSENASKTKDDDDHEEYRHAPPSS
jgi:hypothetical protein